MISVLIVDDEYLIRSLIRNSVRWEAYGMEVVGEAGDGESALSFIRTFQPQIALVDINMPILNGLELAQKVREGNYKTHIIFLTGYRDFEYAKQAVTYQAFDYLLKPIDADELAETLIRLSGQIAREQRLVDHVQKIEKQSDRGKRLLRERFLRRLVFGRMHMTQQQLTEQMRRLEISLEPRNLAVMVVELDLTDRNEDDGLYVYAVLNMLEELLEASGGFSHIEGISEIDNCAVVLCNADGEGRELCRLLREAWQELTGIVGEHFPFTLTAGVSRRYQGYDRLGTAMQEAMDALGESSTIPIGACFSRARPRPRPGTSRSSEALILRNCSCISTLESGKRAFRFSGSFSVSCGKSRLRRRSPRWRPWGWLLYCIHFPQNTSCPRRSCKATENPCRGGSTKAVPAMKWNGC